MSSVRSSGWDQQRGWRAGWAKAPGTAGAGSLAALRIPPRLPRAWTAWAERRVASRKRANVPCTLHPNALALIRGPARFVVMLLEFAPRDPAAQHRTRESPFVGTEREIDVDHHYGDQRHGGKAVHHVDPTPLIIGQHIRIAAPQR